MLVQSGLCQGRLPPGKRSEWGEGEDNYHLEAYQGLGMIFHRLEEYHGIACFKLGENSEI